MHDAVILINLYNLEAILGRKYFKAWYYTTQTNHQWEIFFLYLSYNWLGYGL